MGRAFVSVSAKRIYKLDPCFGSTGASIRKVDGEERPRSRMNHDRIHAREPTHDIARWSTGTIESIEHRDGHCFVTVATADDETVELVVTLAVRDLFLSRLEIEDGASPVGERVWYRKHGGRK